MPYSAQEYESFQAFLDENQYSRKSILRYEKIFGPTYISTGGQETTIVISYFQKCYCQRVHTPNNLLNIFTQEFCKKLDLTPGQKVLDVGCGIGGSAFHMAREYGVEVRGVDLSTNMITLALENQAKQEEEVKKKVILSSSSPSPNNPIYAMFLFFIFRSVSKLRISRKPFSLTSRLTLSTAETLCCTLATKKRFLPTFSYENRI